MNKIEEDPIIGTFFDTPKKKARWIVLFKILYLVWIIFLIIGIIFIFFSYLLK